MDDIEVEAEPASPASPEYFYDENDLQYGYEDASHLISRFDPEEEEVNGNLGIPLNFMLQKRVQVAQEEKKLEMQDKVGDAMLGHINVDLMDTKKKLENLQKTKK